MHPLLHLRFLSLSSCQLDDSSLVQVAWACPALEELDISRNHDLTPTGLAAALVRLPSLRALNLSACRRLFHDKTTTFRALLASAPHLRYLVYMGLGGDQVPYTDEHLHLLVQLPLAGLALTDVSSTAHAAQLMECRTLRSLLLYVRISEPFRHLEAQLAKSTRLLYGWPAWCTEGVWAHNEQLEQQRRHEVVQALLALAQGRRTSPPYCPGYHAT